jgi:hypothetical protein
MKIFTYAKRILIRLNSVFQHNYLAGVAVAAAGVVVVAAGVVFAAGVAVVAAGVAVTAPELVLLVVSVGVEVEASPDLFSQATNTVAIAKANNTFFIFFFFNFYNYEYIYQKLKKVTYFMKKFFIFFYLATFGLPII